MVQEVICDIHHVPRCWWIILLTGILTVKPVLSTQLFSFNLITSVYVLNWHAWIICPIDFMCCPSLRKLKMVHPLGNVLVVLGIKIFSSTKSFATVRNFFKQLRYCCCFIFLISFIPIFYFRMAFCLVCSQTYA